MMMSALRVLALSGFATVPSLQAQQLTVSGTVSATDGVPLSGVSVRVLTTELRAVTDSAGKYSVGAPSDGVLSFSMSGRRASEIAIGGRNTIDVTLDLDQRGWWSRLRPGRTVRVSAADGTTEGTFARLANERLVVTTTASADSIPVRQIDMVWQRAPASERGARIGAVTGGLALAALTYAKTWNSCGYWSDTEIVWVRTRCDATHMVTLGLGSAVLGGLAGALVGSVIGRRHLAWSRVHGPSR